MMQIIEQERKNYTIFPPDDKIWRCIEECPFEKIKYVIIGQDPYHGDNQANGLAFSVDPGVKPPPSLKNIIKEYKNSTGEDIHDISELTKKGYLLLNRVLTVRKGKPGSHRNMGWEIETDALIKKISDEKTHVVFLLWGNDAQKVRHLIDESKHDVRATSHPSPLSAYRGFLGSRCFI